MKTTPTILSILCLLATPAHVQAKPGSGGKDRLAAEKALREFVPELRVLEDKLADDPEIQLGLGLLYAEHGGSADLAARARDRYDRVLAIDPNNKVVRAIIAVSTLGQYLGRRDDLLTDLELQKKYAKTNNLREVRIPERSNLYEWFREQDSGIAVIKDFNDARALICAEVDKDLPNVLSTLEWAEANDPENAFYSYLRAYLWFERNEDEKAVQQIEEGNAKRYLSSYRIEKQAARLGVLREAGFPESHRRFFEDSHPVAGDFSFSKKLYRLARLHAAEGDLESAERMYKLTIGVADHIEAEQLSYGTGPENGIGPSIRAEANRRLQALRGFVEPDDTSVRRRTVRRVGHYASALGLSAILMITVLMVIQRRRARRNA